eukprot:TRINITY_DN3834_c0_g1_i1.p1 TRINITY_DN3834_c0_g1~~TRINITY_DN3834_c0_g1_i1.p1  ORF type:complete len:419 (-),score=89.43 TRINITY_DN3834_c0_g1_i1:1466-2692(-)
MEEPGMTVGEEHKCENECKNNATAVKYCRDCKLYYCNSCDQSIHSFVALRQHARIKAVDRDRVGDRCCSEHEDELLKLFCSTCSHPICRDCKDSVLGKHSQHKIVRVEQVVEDLRKSDESSMATFTSGITTYSTALKGLNEELDSTIREFGKLGELLRNSVGSFERSNSELILALASLQTKANSDYDYLKSTENHLDYVAARKVLMKDLSAFQDQVKILPPAHWEELNATLKMICQSVSELLLKGKLQYPESPAVKAQRILEEEEKKRSVEYKFAGGLDEAVMTSSYVANKGTLLQTGIHRWKVRVDKVVPSTDVGVVSPQHSSHFNRSTRTAWGLREHGAAYYSNVSTQGKFADGSILEFELNCQANSLSCAVQGIGVVHTFTDVVLPVHIAFSGGAGAKATIIRDL